MFARFRRKSDDPSLSAAHLTREDTASSRDSSASGQSRSSGGRTFSSRLRRKSRDSTFSSASTITEEDYVATRPLASRSRSTGDGLEPSYKEGASKTDGPALLSPEFLEPDLAFPLNSLGLHVAYSPSSSPSADVVFVHGLGGTSHQTWSWQRDVKSFWPGEWLPREESLRNTRIFSFGYDANFKSSRSNVITNISDFAKDLLFCIKFARAESGGQFEIGKRPLIFVGHSMGGLVIKKACLLGRIDPHYAEIISSLKAILFLATPHRGSNLAETLNRILSVSPISSTKQYVADLQRSSAALEDLNEQFRNIPPQVQLFSFYETVETSLGGVNKLIVDKSSSILGYASEISKPLYADHHNACKYASTRDENYISVRNTISAIITQHQAENQFSLSDESAQELRKIRTFLGIDLSHLPEDDLDFFHKRKAPGTCEWCIAQPEFERWLNDEFPASRVLWLISGPASGKSILAAHIIRELNAAGKICPYFFFRFGDQNKRSLGLMIKAMALQIAMAVPQYRQSLVRLSEVSGSLDSADARNLWQRLFVTTLFTIHECPRLFWIFDGLDECDATRTLIDLLSSITLSLNGIRILATSRMTPSIQMRIESLSSGLHSTKLSLKSSTEDFATYARNELDPIPWPTKLREQVIAQVLERARGSFLWVHLALNEIVNCHTPDAIQQVLEDLPTGMEDLYRSIEADLLKNTRPGDRVLAKKILQWATCSRWPLTISQLKHALLPEFPTLLDARYTINQLCGHFIVIDDKERITMLHQTARDYLLRSSESKLSLQTTDTHSYLLDRSLATCSDQGPRAVQKEGTKTDLVAYAKTSWPYHLKSCSASSDDTLNAVVNFLNKESVLQWIESLASSKELKTLVYTSKVLTQYAAKRRKVDATKIPLLHRLGDLDLIESWATDLLRIVGKFGSVLIDEPSSIFKLIPPFCPRESAIFRLAGTDSSPLALRITGLSDHTWDDRLAKISIGQNTQALMIRSSAKAFAVATSALKIVLWDTQSLEVSHILDHDEHITALNFSHRGEMLVTFGFKTTRVWNVVTGKQIHSIDNPAYGRALTVRFSPDDNHIYAGGIDRCIRRLDLSHSVLEWYALEFRDDRDDHAASKSYQNSPDCISFSPDTSMVAFAYRGSALAVWNLEPARMINQCLQDGGYHQKKSHAWLSVDRVQWHPIAGELLGVFIDGSIFKWHPYRNELQQLPGNASEIDCSEDGTIFAVSDTQGTIKLYNYEAFSLVYQLACDSPVVALSLSPDCQRLYDIRDSTCNIWEPNALVRLADPDFGGSETNSEIDGSIVTRGISEAWSEQVDMITALIPASPLRSILVGDESGTVCAYNLEAEENVFLWTSRSYMTIESLACSANGSLLASADLGGRVIICKLKSEASSDLQPSSLEPKRLLDEGFGTELGSIAQLLFDPLSQFLLIFGRNGTMLWSVAEKSATTIDRDHSTQISRRYINHPLRDQQLLAFDLEGVSIYEWKSLTVLSRLSYHDAQIILTVSDGTTDTGDTSGALAGIERIIVSNDKRYIVLFITHSGKNIHQTPGHDSLNTRQKYIRIISADSLTSAMNNPFRGTKTVEQIAVEDAVSARLELPLGVVSGDRLVFIDNKNWLCTWQIGTAVESERDIQRHYFLPRDWLGTDELKICSLMEDGSLLYPKQGQVAVVRSNIALWDGRTRKATTRSDFSPER